MDNEKNIFSPLEVARIIGQPLDPRKPYPQIVEECCETDTGSVYLSTGVQSIP